MMYLTVVNTLLSNVKQHQLSFQDVFLEEHK